MTDHATHDAPSSQPPRRLQALCRAVLELGDGNVGDQIAFADELARTANDWARDMRADRDAWLRALRP